jgi:hypothetical protein
VVGDDLSTSATAVPLVITIVDAAMIDGSGTEGLGSPNGGLLGFDSDLILFGIWRRSAIARA